MAKKKEVVEQMELIDVHPENEKEIIQQARLYKAAQVTRTEALAEEVATKKKLLELIEAAGLQRLEDGKIQFRCDGFLITVTPRDQLISVKDEVEK